jgi:hypothetical protein
MEGLGPGQSQLHLGMTPNRTTGIHSNTESLCVRPWASGRTHRVGERGESTMERGSEGEREDH